MAIESSSRTRSSAMSARLDQLDEQANRLTKPITYESTTYVLRNRIGIIRERLKAH